jgi:DmsE family decaheme c-type cytochrome
MSTRHWRGLAGALMVLAVVIGWAAASAQPRVQRAVDWVAVHPEFEGATYVNDLATCQTCHEEVMESYAHTTHARAFDLASDAAGQCESCHGPRSKHIEDPTDVLAFDGLPARTQSAVCLQCHEGGSRMGWKAGAHQSNDVSCASCHVVMEKRSDRALLATASATDTCYTCHADVRSDMNKMSHHPVREGKMDCASCHNAHGAPGENLLGEGSVNETCTSCHVEKRGPFLWEHSPAAESCMNCHDPHGSRSPGMLATPMPRLCQQCHIAVEHPSAPQTPSARFVMGRQCSNCHVAVHGSNHPSGAWFVR